MTSNRYQNQRILIWGLLVLLLAGVSAFALFQRAQIFAQANQLSASQAKFAQLSVFQELNANLRTLDKFAGQLMPRLRRQLATPEELLMEARLLESSLPSLRTIRILDRQGQEQVLPHRKSKRPWEITQEQYDRLLRDGTLATSQGANLTFFVATPVEDHLLGKQTSYLLVAEMESHYFEDMLWRRLEQTEAYSTILAITTIDNRVLFMPSHPALQGSILPSTSGPQAPAMINSAASLDSDFFENQTRSHEEIHIPLGQRSLSLKVLALTDPSAALEKWTLWALIDLVVLLFIVGVVQRFSSAHNRQMVERDREREVAARRLSESTERLRLATSSAGIGVWEYNIENKTIRWSNSMSILYGMADKARVITREEWRDLVAQEDQTVFDQLFESLTAASPKKTVQFKIRTIKTRKLTHIQGEATLYCDEQGRPLRILGINQDVTQQQNFGAALQEAEERFRSAFESAAVGIALYGTDGRFVQTNAAFNRMLGFDLNETVIGDFDSYTHPQDLRVEEVPRKNLANDSIQNYQIEKRLIHRDGHVIWVSISVSAVRNRSNELLYFIAQVQDITERKKNEASLIEREHFLRTLSECLPGLVSYWGQDLRCHFANRNYEDWTGLPMKQLRGIHMRKLLGDSLFESDQAFIIGVLRGERQQFQRRKQRPDGSWADTLMHFIPDVLYGRVEGFFALSTDITELKTQQRELEQMNKQLVLRTDQAEAASRAKSSFLANMSHEIRTPMNAIMGLLQLIGDTNVDERQRDYLSKIGNAAEVLLNVLNDVLDVSRIEANKLVLTPSRFNLDTLLQKTVDLFKYRATEQGIHLHCVKEIGCPTSLVADRLRLAQILNNLLSNALKFTEKGEITLRVKPSEDKSHLTFSVRDSGIGLKPEEAAKLFSPFSQADSSSSRKFGGAGLGLSICKSLTELMGGEIRVESEYGIGSTFSFSIINQEPDYRADQELLVDENEPTQTIERQTPLSLSKTLSQKEKNPLAGKKILIADDHKLNRLVAGQMVENVGAIVVLAKNGQEAIDACQKETFDAILMDLQMPEVDGFEATAQISALLGHRAPPIIAVTASATEQDRLAILSSGMCEHIIKPFKKEDLIRVLEQQSSNPVVS